MQVIKNRNTIQSDLSWYISEVRKRAPDFIIRNTAGTRNPHRARKAQPSHPTQLTERTGKLLYMLKDRANQGFIAGKIFKRESVGLRETVRDVTGSDMSFKYLGTIRTKKVIMDRFLSARRLGKYRVPEETPQTMEMRLMHELGFYVKPQLVTKSKDVRKHYVRQGERKARPFFKPAAETLRGELVKRLAARLNA